MLWYKIKKRIKEPTTWIGISILATLAGIPPETIAMGAKIISAVGAITGIALPENQP